MGTKPVRIDNRNVKGTQAQTDCRGAGGSACSSACACGSACSGWHYKTS